MRYDAPNLAKRFPGAFATATIATIASAVLSIGLPPWGAYDRNLAVLTATLIALIWYTFFTFCALHREERGRLTFLVARGASRAIEFTVKNPTLERLIEFRWRVAGARHGKAIDLAPALGDPVAHLFALMPGEQRGDAFHIAEPAKVPGSQYGAAVQRAEPDQMVLQIDLVWRDDIGGEGSIGPEFYAVDVLDCRVNRFQDRAKGADTFRALGGATLPTLRADA